MVFPSNAPSPRPATHYELHEPFVDLAPHIHRQRLVVEGVRETPIAEDEICRYLVELGPLLDMVVLIEPVTHLSELYGWSAWVHWETSGAHFYAWDDPVFFSVDIYTCKAFEPGAAIAFTAEFFKASSVTHREF